MKKELLFFGAVAALIACTANQTQAGNKSRSLVVYYSQSGTTEKVANIIQKKTGADIERIETVEPYSGDMGAIAGAFMGERRDGKVRDLKPMKAKIADYDTLYVGYPIWAGTCAGPIHSLIKSNDFKGKVVVPFCTFGSGGNTSIADLKAGLPGAKVSSSWYGVRAARVDKAEELETAVHYAVKESFDNKAIIEGFMNGPEYSAECICYKGEVTVLALTKKMTTDTRILNLTKKRLKNFLSILIINSEFFHIEVYILNSKPITNLIISKMPV